MTFEPTSSAAATRCAVTICRDHHQDAWGRRTFARVDMGANHTFTFGHVVTIALTPGRHSLYVGESPLERTVRFEVGEGEHLKFTLICQPPIPGFGFLARLGFVPASVRILRSTQKTTSAVPV